MADFRTGDRVSVCYYSGEHWGNGTVTLTRADSLQVSPNCARVRIDGGQVHEIPLYQLQKIAEAR